MARGEAWSAGEGTVPPPGAGPSRRRLAGLVAGPLVFTVLLVLPPPAGLEAEGWRTAALGLLMAIWWLTEAIPIPATALLPLVLVPLLGAGTIGEAAAPYANPVIFLFLGGFLIAIAMERWGLHRRIALGVLARTGARPRGLVAGFLLVSAFLSMWVSNTATAMMMLPIGISVLELARGRARAAGPEVETFGVALMLAIAYGASIGGLATLIGTPPNALLAGFLAEVYDLEVGFARWMLLGLPLTAVALPLAYLLLTRVSFPFSLEELEGGRELIGRELRALGPLRGPETAVACTFAAVALLWIFRPLLESRVPGLSDAGIAVAGGLALFLIPADPRRGTFVLDWESAERVPWDILLLFGGGLSLAAAIERTALNAWLGAAAGGAGASLPLLVLVTTTAIVFLTELTSNTATAAAFLPVVAAVAVEAGWSPLALAVPAALGASCAFMLPVATPPNAIVYGSHRVTLPQMARAGIGLNLLMILLIGAAAYLLVPIVFGVPAAAP